MDRKKKAFKTLTAVEPTGLSLPCPLLYSATCPSHFMGDMIPISTPELLYKYLAIAVVPVGYGSDKSTTSNMVPLQDALTALILIIASYVAHLIWSRRRVQRGIANIPAPKSVSFWTGISHRNYIFRPRILIKSAYVNIQGTCLCYTTLNADGLFSTAYKMVSLDFTGGRCSP